MAITVDIGAPWMRASSKAFALWVKTALGVLVTVNRVSLRFNPRLPLLYQSGIRYRNEPPGVDTFRDIHSVLALGYGDCAHLAAWRAAELIERFRDKKAHVAVKWFPEHEGPGKPRMFHVIVRHGNGRLEDPSKLLGMNSHA